MLRQFLAEIDSESGELGWRDSRIPRNSNTFGSIAFQQGLAHDCLEHLAFEHVGDEIEAHGAMYRLRYEGGWQDSYGYSLEIDDFGAEWINLGLALFGDSQLFPPSKTRKLEDAVEEDISQIMESGAKQLRDDIDDCGLEVFMIEERFRDYFRIGYRKAAKRYKGNVCFLFQEIADIFKTHKPEYEGQELKLNISLKDLTVSASLVEPIW